MSRVRVLVADDHAMVREGLARLIADQPDMRVVAEAADGEAALHACLAHQPHVVVLDLRMPGIGGVAAIRRLRERCPSAQLLVLSMYEDASYVRAALAAGAHAYVAKRAGAATLLAAIRALRVGERFVAGDVIADAVRGEPGAALSAREHEVVRMLVRGHTGREVAAALGISKSSADTYRARVFRKLGVDSRAELIARFAAIPGELADDDVSASRGEGP